MQEMGILLFDMDHVLVLPRGYQRALRETVALVSHALGFKPLKLSSQAIEIFESCGVTSEWDSAALCTALLLCAAWQNVPQFTWPEKLPLPRLAPHALREPDFVGFFQELAEAEKHTAEALRKVPRPSSNSGQLSLPVPLPPLNPEHSSTADALLLVPPLGTEPPLKRGERLLLEQRKDLSLLQKRTLQGILQNAREIKRSITHQLIQEHVLGSESYTRTYGLKASLKIAPGYLLSEDLPGLNAQTQKELSTWLSKKNHHAAVFTNRPCLSPDKTLGTPEAEMGIKLLGRPELPLVGLEHLRWLGRELDTESERYIKPSLVHALTALALTQGLELKEALLAAANPASFRAIFCGLDQAKVWVFEDSDHGLESARAAQRALAAVEIHCTLYPCGISTSSVKQQKLKDWGAAVFSNLDQALHEVEGWPRS